MSDYYKYKESHLKAQKKWKENNQDKVKEYERKRYEKRKQLKQENETLKVNLQEANDNAEWWNNRYNAIKRQIDQLTNNWNELEEWLKEYMRKNENWYTNELSTYDKQYYGDTYYTTNAVLMTILDKMKEIKGNI